MKSAQAIAVASLAVLFCANFVIPDRASRHANMEYANQALAAMRAQHRAPLDPASAEVRSIFERATETARLAFREKFELTSLVVAPAAALVTGLFLARYAIMIAAIFLLMFGGAFMTGMGGWLSLLSFMLSFSIALAFIRFRSRRAGIEP